MAAKKTPRPRERRTFDDDTTDLVRALDAWREETQAFRKSFEPIAVSLHNIDLCLKVISGSVMHTGHFIRRWSPWVVAALASWIGISPSVIKALVSVTGLHLPQ